MTYFLAFIFFILLVITIAFVNKLNTKIFLISIISACFIWTIFLSFSKPVMHKKLNVNVIEKMLKINQDGSYNIIETTTTTELKEK